jgi:hypothetical protein
VTLPEIFEREKDRAMKRAKKFQKSARFAKAAAYYHGLAVGLDFALDQWKIAFSNTPPKKSMH